MKKTGWIAGPTLAGLWSGASNALGPFDLPLAGCEESPKIRRKSLQESGAVEGKGGAETSWTENTRYAQESVLFKVDQGG